MKAMILNGVCSLGTNRKPLTLVDVPVPECGANDILVKVSACGVCHTELDEIEGRTPPSQFPVILGHQIIGRVHDIGEEVKKHKRDDRVGIAWIYSSCGKCSYCLEGEENLCDQFKATGRDANGGYAEYVVVPENFAYPIPEIFSDREAAPLLCAGAVGYRSLRLTTVKNGENLGFVGFGASAHIVIQLARHLYPESKFYVFARSYQEREFAKELGALWSGDIEEEPPEKIKSIIDTTPVWGTVVAAMKHIEKGGRLVINAIRKEEIDKEALLSIDYPTHLWLEKEIKSVANVTKKDVEEFLAVASQIPIRPEVQVYRLEEANEALMELKERKIRGAKVILF